MGMREDFEAWANLNRYDMRKSKRLVIDAYSDPSTNSAWDVWMHLYPEVERLRSESAELQRQLMAIRAGHTKTVEYDLSPAMQASAVRDKLIELGWTPPTKAKLEADND